MITEVKATRLENCCSAATVSSPVRSISVSESPRRTIKPVEGAAAGGGAAVVEEAEEEPPSAAAAASRSWATARRHLAASTSCFVR